MRINNKKLTNIEISGFKSISNEGQSIPINDITILLGANGAGKSNFISFLKMVNYMTSGALQNFVGQSGTSDTLLHFGSKKTTRITAELTFSNSSSIDKYIFSLAHAASDTLIFTEESLSYFHCSFLLCYGMY